MSTLAGLMNTFAIVSATSETSAMDRGGSGRKAKFHQTQMKSRLLRIERESKKQRRSSTARPAHADRNPALPVVLPRRLGHDQVQADAGQHEDDREREPGRDQTEERPEPGTGEGSFLQAAGAQRRAGQARANIRSQEYCLISAE